jgi:hypothetical protein
MTNVIERLHEEFKRRIKTRTGSALGVARLWPDQHARGRRLANIRHRAHPSAN